MLGVGVAVARDLNVVITFELYGSQWMAVKPGTTHQARHGMPTRFTNTEDWLASRAGTAVERKPRADFNIEDVPMSRGRIFDVAPDRLVLVLEVEMKGMKIVAPPQSPVTIEAEPPSEETEEPPSERGE